MRNRLSFFALIVISTFVYSSCAFIKPNSPTVPESKIPKIPQPISVVDIPITANLESYFRQAEGAVPTQYSGNENPCQGVRYSYLFQRSPFTITGTGNTLNLSFIGMYQLSGAYCAKCFFNNCVAPKVGFSCGTGGESMRRVDIKYNSTFNVMPNYSLQSNTSLTTLNPIDRCKITVLGIDITDKLINGVRGPLNSLGSKVDQMVSNVDVKSKITPLWNKISQSIKLGTYGYLNLNPNALRLSSINMSGSILNFSIGLSANPVISTQSKPSTASPLPNLSDFTPGNGFNIYLDLNAGYDTLSQQLNNRVVGKEIKIGHREIKITNAKIYGIGNSKLVVEVTFKGTRKGSIYLVGTPSYNPISHVLTIPDIDFDLQTKSVLLKVAKWLLNDKIISELKSKSVYDLTFKINDEKTKFQSELNRNIGDNIRIIGSVNDLNIESIYPTSTQLQLRVISNGKLAVILN